MPLKCMTYRLFSEGHPIYWARLHPHTPHKASQQVSIGYGVGYSLQGALSTAKPAPPDAPQGIPNISHRLWHRLFPQGRLINGQARTRRPYAFFLKSVLSVGRIPLLTRIPMKGPWEDGGDDCNAVELWSQKRKEQVEKEKPALNKPEGTHNTHARTSSPTRCAMANMVDVASKKSR
eukprot:872398-Pelagomonas_calceolata.AAC.4